MRIVLAIIIFQCSLTTLEAQEPKLVLPIGHAGDISDIVFRGDNLISLGEDGLLKFWNIPSGNLLKEIDNVDKYFRSSKLNYSSDGGILLLPFTDGYIKTVNLNTGAIQSTINADDINIDRVFYSYDRKLIIGEFKQLQKYAYRLWNASNGKKIFDIPGRGFDSRCEDIISSDNTRLLTFSDSSLNVWNIRNGKSLFSIPGEYDTDSKAAFNRDGDRILIMADTFAGIYESHSGKLLKQFAGDWDNVAFSPDGHRALLYSWDDSTVVVNTLNGEAVASLKSSSDLRNGSIVFSEDGKRLLTSCDGEIRLYNIETGDLLKKYGEPGKGRGFINVGFGPQEKTIVSAGGRGTSFSVWDAQTEKRLKQVENGSEIDLFKVNADNTLMATRSFESITIWETGEFSEITRLTGHTIAPKCSVLDSSNMRLIVGYGDGSVRYWNLFNGRCDTAYKIHKKAITKMIFSNDSSSIFSSTNDGELKFWDAGTGEEIWTHQFEKAFEYIGLSYNGKYVLIRDAGSSISVLDGKTGKQIKALVPTKFIFDFTVNPQKNTVLVRGDGSQWFVVDIETGNTVYKTKSPEAYFDRTGNNIISVMADAGVRLENISEKKILYEIEGKIDYNQPIAVKLDNAGERLYISSVAGIEVWDLQKGEHQLTLDSTFGTFESISVSADGYRLLGWTSWGKMAIWDTRTGKVLREFYDSGSILEAFFVNGGSQFVSLSSSKDMTLWDVENNDALYAMLAIDSSDYLVFDGDFRYDGTEGAINLLHFTCDMEVIGLDQLKDELWVPGLSERISRKEIINSRKLSQLDVCTLMPDIKSVENLKSYSFMITPRKGGVGDVAVLVNGIEVRRYDVNDLVRKDGRYELKIDKSELETYFMDGAKNAVFIKAFTPESGVFARGNSISADKRSVVAAPTNLYAIMVGISDYKGNTLDLRYPAKDALDLSGALYLSARKLLNTDGKEHVFIYNINTSDKRSFFPEKQSIRKVFETIGAKATPNDILFVFFAGHGTTKVPAGVPKGKQQFYFLTAEASSAADYTFAGISMQEIGEWMKPDKIKAQKRILIFDACNSGQAINDFITLGDKGQKYIAARSGEEDARTRLLEKLKDRSGLFILSAAASTQEAYEVGELSQGLLTYSLLKSLKEQPSILDNGRFLNVDRWFAASEKIVSDALSKTIYRQNPQKFGAGGFNVGIVDNDVISKITIAKEKPLFKGSLLLNKSSNDDDLDLVAHLNRALENAAAREQPEISYVAATSSPEAYSLTGSYQLAGNVVTISLNIKQGKNIPYKFTVSGDSRNLPVVSSSVVARALQWLQGKR